ncbi:hypothetical protein PF001_g12280 [Phytophthora fragariae]|uniref:Uncharacterized protein n=1 Tax=Phytophthora fragariae TaxID=53985 RepID=A0A6A4DNT6_9STRA|nr:hypothetical protein PF001_g12280 [Phytophthora fragariae]
MPETKASAARHGAQSPAATGGPPGKQSHNFHQRRAEARPTPVTGNGLSIWAKLALSAQAVTLRQNASERASCAMWRMEHGAVTIALKNIASICLQGWSVTAGCCASRAASFGAGASASTSGRGSGCSPRFLLGDAGIRSPPPRARRFIVGLRHIREIGPKRRLPRRRRLAQCRDRGPTGKGAGYRDEPQDLNKLWIKPSCRRIARATDSEPNVIYLWWYYIKEAEVAMVDTAGR